ncbi:MAG: hypothetical protein J6Q32_05565 [Clostridia bacterium]|nr:hypothetical protein [Clostridia bacterium]
MIEQKTHKATNNLIFYLILALLFFMAMNFSAKFFYFAFASILVYFAFRFNLRFDYTFLVYFAVSAIMAYFQFEDGLKAMLRVFASTAVYVLGFNLIVDVLKYKNIDKKSEVLRRLFLIIIAVALGTAVHFILNYIINYGKDLGRNTIDIWSGQIASATNQATIACIMSGLSCALIIKAPKPVYRILAILVTIFILTYNLVLAGRTIIVIYATVFLVALFFYLQQTKNLKTFIKVIIWLSIIILVCGLIYNNNLFGIKDTILNSNLYDRFFGKDSMDLTETGRGEKRIFFLAHLFEYPFGGLNMRSQVGYAHDLLLDAYDEYSVFCALLLVVILIISIKNMLKFIFNVNVQLTYRLIILCVYLAIYIQFFLEPIFAGAPWLYVIFCLLNGALSAINRLKL